MKTFLLLMVFALCSCGAEDEVDWDGAATLSDDEGDTVTVSGAVWVTDSGLVWAGDTHVGGLTIDSSSVCIDDGPCCYSLGNCFGGPWRDVLLDFE